MPREKRKGSDDIEYGQSRHISLYQSKNYQKNNSIRKNRVDEIDNRVIPSSDKFGNVDFIEDPSERIFFVSSASEIGLGNARIKSKSSFIIDGF